jgi:sodium/potassium-transporting ATPase subunit alpha
MVRWLILLVSRDGEKLTIKADELTVGDIVEIKFGDRVPADIRVLEARSFKAGFSDFYNFISEH